MSWLQVWLYLHYNTNEWWYPTLLCICNYLFMSSSQWKCVTGDKMRAFSVETSALEQNIYIKPICRTLIWHRFKGCTDIISDFCNTWNWFWIHPLWLWSVVPKFKTLLRNGWSKRKCASHNWGHYVHIKWSVVHIVKFISSNFFIKNKVWK